MRKIMRKVYVIINGIKKFFGFKISTTGVTTPIVKVRWKYGRNEKGEAHVERKKKIERKETRIIEGYVPTSEIHHSATGFKYSCIGRDGKIITKQRWTDEEWEKAIREKKEGYTIEEIAKLHGRSKGSVSSKFSDMKRKGVI